MTTTVYCLIYSKYSWTNLICSQFFFLVLSSNWWHLTLVIIVLYRNLTKVLVFKLEFSAVEEFLIKRMLCVLCCCFLHAFLCLIHSWRVKSTNITLCYLIVSAVKLCLADGWYFFEWHYAQTAFLVSSPTVHFEPNVLRGWMPFLTLDRKSFTGPHPVSDSTGKVMSACHSFLVFVAFCYGTELCSYFINFSTFCSCVLC